MLNPDDLLDAWVALLQDTPSLVAMFANKVSNITAYKDGYPQVSNLRRQIQAQPPGSILAVFMGTDKVRLSSRGGAWAFRHKFSFYVLAAESTGAELPASYAAIWSAFVNGVPSHSPLPLLHTEVVPDCEPMDLEGPTSQRSSLLISPDGETLDYFEFTATLIEKAA
jgi:hypothetical protein